MKKQKKVGIYGGSFDPIHFGHLNLVLEIKEAHRLDEVWFCPARISPHKMELAPVAAFHRFKMLELAIEDLPQMKIIDLEIKREGPSYTIDTIRQLLKLESENADPRQLNLIIGDDMMGTFSHWHEPDEIVKLVPLLVGRRACPSPITLDGSVEVRCALEKGYTPTRVLDISSTNIRSRLQQGLYIRHLVPGKVVDYIYAHHLY